MGFPIIENLVGVGFQCSLGQCKYKFFEEVDERLQELE